MKKNILRLIALSALITFNSPAFSAEPTAQPQVNLPVTSFTKCSEAISAGFLGISTITAYTNIFGCAGLINGAIRIAKTKMSKNSLNLKNIAAGAIGLASVWSGLNNFTGILNFHDNFTNLAHLISALDLIARPSLLAITVDAAAADQKEAYSGIKNYLGNFEIVAKALLVAPTIIKTLPIFYKLITQ